MPNIFTSLSLGLTILTVADSAEAAVVETWQFSQGGYTSQANDFSGMGTLSGSFTGSVEPNWFIALGDLTGFAASWSFDPVSVSLGNLAWFSFNTTGGGSTLAIEGTNHDGTGVNFCVGAVTTLEAACLATRLPPGSNGVEFFDVAVTRDVASATLVSTVTPVPEPGSVLLLLSGVSAVLWLSIRRPLSTDSVEKLPVLTP